MAKRKLTAVFRFADGCERVSIPEELPPDDGTRLTMKNRELWYECQAAMHTGLQCKGSGVAGKNRTDKAEDYWKPWQARYRELVAGGTSKGNARYTIADEMQKGGHWPPPHQAHLKSKFPSDPTLNKWLKK